MGRSTTAQLRDKDRHLTVSQHDTDAPILPVEQIARLREIHPERVDWVFQEATKEGDFRRSETKRVNTFVFIERVGGIVAGLSIGLYALHIAYSLAMAQHYAVASIVGGTTVLGLVSAFVIGAKRKAKQQAEPPPKK